MIFFLVLSYENTENLQCCQKKNLKKDQNFCSKVPKKDQICGPNKDRNLTKFSLTLGRNSKKLTYFCT